MIIGRGRRPSLIIVVSAESDNHCRGKIISLNYRPPSDMCIVIHFRKHCMKILKDRSEYFVKNSYTGIMYEALALSTLCRYTNS